MFNLEKEINNWLSSLRANPGFEDGDIAELEDHIRDAIQLNIESGMTEQEAFESANASFGSLGDTGVEMTKSRTSNMKTPKTDLLAHNYSHSIHPLMANSIMFSNYLKIAARNIRKQKLFSIINIFSLTIGLAATLLIFLFIHDELSFDKFNVKKSTIFRVLQVQKNVDGSLDYKGTSHAIGMGPELVNKIPGIKRSVRFFENWTKEDSYVRTNNMTLRQSILYGDFEVFKMFSIPILQGTADNNSPYNVLLSERAVTKHFGDEDPIGKSTSVRIDNEFVDFTVVGVFANIPSNSSIQFDFLLSFGYLTEVGFMREFVDNWGFGAVNTFIETESTATTTNMQSALDKLLSTHYPYYTNIAEERGYEKATSYRQLELQPLLNVHFDSTITNGLRPSSNKLYSILLGIVALGILLIGCINFMNLSIGRSSNRAKEIGLRKTIGASRRQLISQFLNESIVMAFLALVLAILTIQLLLPLFNELTEKELSLSTFAQLEYALLIIGLTILTGFIAGVYPAFGLSSAKIDDAFSGKLKIGGANLFTRVLVVFQFTLATVLIIAMLVITSQLNYIRNKDLGFSGDQVVVIANNSVGNSTIYSHYTQVLDGVPGIVHISSANQTFGGERGLGGMGFEYKGKPMRTGVIKVSADYLKTMEITLESGRGFNPEISTDFTRAVIVNETCFREFELDLGEPFESLGRTGKKEDDPVVIGVMNDFNYNSLAVGVEPMLIQLSKSDKLNYILIKVSADNIPSTISSLSDAWNTVAPDLPFEYTFLDESMSTQYSSQQKWSMIISISMIIAIALSCFGLFGMVAMAIAGKRSEIGVRKVLGASIIQIINYYSWKYTKLVAIAFVLAIPVSYFSLEKWLESFANRINMEIYIFVIAGFIIVAISFITILYKIGEAAISNPAHVLRDE